MFPIFHCRPLSHEWSDIKAELAKEDRWTDAILAELDSNNLMIDVSNHESLKDSRTRRPFIKDLGKLNSGMKARNWKTEAIEHELCLLSFNDINRDFTDYDPKTIKQYKVTGTSVYALVWIIKAKHRKAKPKYDPTEKKIQRSKRQPGPTDSQKTARKIRISVIGSKNVNQLDGVDKDDLSQRVELKLKELDNSNFEKGSVTLDVEYLPNAGANETISFNPTDLVVNSPNDFIVYFVNDAQSDDVLRDLAFLSGRMTSTLLFSEDTFSLPDMADGIITQRRFEGLDKVCQIIASFAEQRLDREIQEADNHLRVVDLCNCITNHLLRLDQIENVRLLQKHDLLERILQYACADSNFSVTIELDFNFLLWARRFFEDAKSVTAVSMDTVSMFWNRSEYAEQVRRYVGSHSAVNNSRIFVFESPSSLADHRHALDFHFGTYGHQKESQRHGGVYVTSAESFQGLLESNFPRICESCSAGGNSPFDFGIVTTRDDKEYLLVLSHKSFQCIPLDSKNKKLKEDCSKFQTMFESDFEKVTEGTLGDVQGVPVARWAKHFGEGSSFKELTKSLFDHSDVLHFVCFRLKSVDSSYYKKFKDAFDKLKQALRNEENHLRGTYGLKDMTFGTLIKRAIDSETKLTAIGESYFNYENGVDFIYSCRFPSSESLNAYMQDQQHCKARKDFFSEIDGLAKWTFETVKIGEEDKMKLAERLVPITRMDFDVDVIPSTRRS